MKDYYTNHLIEYERPNSISWTSIEVLPFLKGREWDQVALNFVHSLRPSSIRVTDGWMTLDSRSWRVTVVVDDNNIIQSIEQEVEVGCEGFENASEMKLSL